MSSPAPISSGILTFLFTDIEGSTRLWEHFPDEMRIALARHDALVREAVTRQRGHVFKTIGDAFCVAFDEATDALRAAIDAQQALLAESWPENSPIKVRMALHSGVAESRDSDYFGSTLNRVARTLATAHGGQILLSQAAEERVRAFLPSSVTLRDLGLHQLKDLARPELLYQVEHPGLTREFPRIRSLSTFPNNLPQQVTPFIGRERETTELKAFLQKSRLLTLTGSGGTGKTRLGLQVAADTLEQFPDGVWFVELAPLSHPSQVVQAVTSALKITEQPDKPLSELLVEALANKELLIFLDNCEHLLDACATLADRLLRACPKVQLLASSREALGVVGEQTFRVPSLSLPDPQRPPILESLLEYEAVQLFLDRAQLARPDFTVTQENAKALVSLCCRLDGIPLAIELSAGRLRSLSLEEIDSRLNQRFRLLTGGSRTALPRQQTLRALIDWSYDMLGEQEKALLHSLSVFTSGWTLEAAEHICSSETIEDWEVLDLLISLVDKSLVVAEQNQAHTRYRLLESVRAYAAEKLSEQGDSFMLFHRRHAAFFLALAQKQLKQLRRTEEAAALAQLTQDAANLRGALEIAQELEDSTLLGELALVNGILQQRHGFLHEAVEAIELGLSALPTPPLRAKLLLERAGLHADFKEPEAARARVQQALEISAPLQDRRSQAQGENLLGQAAMQERDFSEARRLYRAALANFEAVEDQVGIAIVQNNLGILERRDGQTREAERHFSEALRLRQALHDRRGLAETLNNLGVLAFERQEWEQAAGYYREAIPHYESLWDTLGLGFMFANLGEVAENQQNFHKAARLYLASILLLEQVRSPLAQEIEAWLTRAAAAGHLPDSEVATLRRAASRLSPEAQRDWALGAENSTAPLSYSS